VLRLLMVISALFRVQSAVNSAGADASGCRRATQWGGWWCWSCGGCHGDGTDWVWGRDVGQWTTVGCYRCREELLSSERTKQHPSGGAKLQAIVVGKPWKVGE